MTTASGPSPIVPAAILFDLGVGDPLAFPDADAGYAATLPPSGAMVRLEGRIGAGAGAPSPSWPGPPRRSRRHRQRRRAAFPTARSSARLVVKQRLGDIHARDGRPLVALRVRRGRRVRQHDADRDRDRCRPRPCPVPQARRARPRRAGDRHPPSHTLFDGDVVFTMSTGTTAVAPRGSSRSGCGRRRRGEAIERSVSG